jgi:hypothetical protein
MHRIGTCVSPPSSTPIELAMSRFDSLSINSLADPPAMISAASPFADASIFAIELPWPSSLARPPRVPVLAPPNVEAGEQLIQVQTFRGDVRACHDARLTPVHFDLRHQIAAGHAKIQRREF